MSTTQSTTTQSSSSTQAVALDPARLRALLAHDYRSFAHLFLYDQPGIEHGIPEFHCLMHEFMRPSNPDPTVIAAPRDHSKTTNAKINIIHSFIYDYPRFLAYASNTHVIAAQAVRDIAKLIRLPHVAAIYGEPIFRQAEEAKGNYEFAWCGKNIIMRSLGAGQQVRGLNVDNHRPDLIVLDDIERSSEGAENKMGYQGIKNWIYRDLRKAADSRRAKFIYIGNLSQEVSYLNDCLNDPNWRKLRLSAFTLAGEPLWPARWTLASLRKDFLDYARAGHAITWLAEMLNMTVTNARLSLRASDITIIPPVEPGDPAIHVTCITVDPAIADDVLVNDAAAICLHAYLEGMWVLVDKHVEIGLDPYQVFSHIIRLAERWRTSVVGIEAVAYQQALINVCQRESARMGISHMLFLPVLPGRKSKSARIAAWAGMLRNRQYAVTTDHIDAIQQLSQYNPNAKRNRDDIIDCCAHIGKMEELYMEQILATNAPGYDPAKRGEATRTRARTHAAMATA